MSLPSRIPVPEQKAAVSLETQEIQLLERWLKVLDDKADHFVKPENQLGSQKSVANIFEVDDREVFKKNKLFKKTGSKHRNEGVWYEIASCKADSKCAPQYYRFMVFMGEVMRFEMGDLAPKYRIEACADGSLKLLSRQLENGLPGDAFDFLAVELEKHTVEDGQERDALGKVWRAYKYVRTKHLEGFGTFSVLNLILREDDGNLGNVLVAKFGDHYIFVPIDHEYKLWPLSQQFQAEEIQDTRPAKAIKKVHYASRHKDARLFRFIDVVKDIDEVRAEISSVKYADMGEQHEDDYTGLPYLAHRTPLQNQAAVLALKSIMAVVAKSKVTENEKCYHRLKLCLIPFTKKFLSAYQYGRLGMMDLKKSVDDMLKKEISSAEKLCQDSKAVHSYLKEHRMKAFSTMLCELNMHFHENNHYLPKNKAIWMSIWIDLAGITVDRFNNMLVAQSLKPLDQAEREQLKRNALLAEMAPEKVIPDMVEFYKQQERLVFATRLTMKLADLKARPSDSFPDLQALGEDQVSDSFTNYHELTRSVKY